MCSICLTDVELYLSCCCKAPICRECFINGVKCSLSENKLAKCVCGEEYGLNVVLSGAEKFGQEYLQLVIEKSCNHLYTCGNCLEVCDIIDYDKEIYFCYACKKNTCFKCKKDPHVGPCTKDKDEQATEKYVITCCGVSFIRGDACNLVTCPSCKIGYCWICKVKNVTHGHFVSFSPGCLLFGEREQTILDPDRLVNGKCNGRTKKNKPCQRILNSNKHYCGIHQHQKR